MSYLWIRTLNIIRNSKFMKLTLNTIEVKSLHLVLSFLRYVLDLREDILSCPSMKRNYTGESSTWSWNNSFWKNGQYIWCNRPFYKLNLLGSKDTLLIMLKLIGQIRIFCSLRIKDIFFNIIISSVWLIDYSSNNVHLALIIQLGWQWQGYYS